MVIPDGSVPDRLDVLYDVRLAEAKLIERIADLWEEPCDARCITTNGFIKNNGKLVMGAGVAGQAQARYPLFPKIAGSVVKQYGNHVFPFSPEEMRTNLLGEQPDSAKWFITYPVKHVWYEIADLDLIERSAHELMNVIDQLGLEKVLLPLPGCGNGKLLWSEVKPVIMPILDHRVWAINKTQTHEFDPPESGRTLKFP